MAEWNSTDDAVVRDGLAAGRSYEQIATELGRTPTAVQVRMFSLGLAQQQQLPSTGDASAAAPKRRGRPPKVNSVESSPAAIAAVAPKRRGRPPKINSESDVAEVSAAPKRGRPPKSAAAVVAVSAAVAPKRRGRPPKVAAVAAAAAPVPAVAVAPKATNGNGHHAEPAPVVAKLRRPRAEKSAAPAGGGFMIALGAHRLTAEGAAVELIEGGGLRLKFAGGSIELHGGPSA
jgi:hypothetical protein